MDGAQTPKCALSQYEAPLTVFDPCLGSGLTAQAANDLGHRVIGTELHPRRLAVAIALLAKAGTPPTPIDWLGTTT